MAFHDYGGWGEKWEGSPIIWLINDWSAFPLVGDYLKGAWRDFISAKRRDPMQDITRERPTLRATIRARRDALQRDFIPGLGKRRERV
jgi:hypothetical protein